MDNEQLSASAGWVIIGTTAIAALAMAHHPTVGSSGYPTLIDEVRSEALLNRGVHGVMITYVVLVWAMVCSRTGWVTPDGVGGRLTDTALAFATLTMVGAALASGFFTPKMADQLSVASESDLALFRDALKLSYAANQVLAEAGVLGYGAAIALSGLGFLLCRPMQPVMGLLGIAIGVWFAFGIFAGLLTLDVHGMGMTFGLMAIWFVTLGIAMIREKR
ncbi:MAG: hypothetical protein AAF830_07315 [Pseudomonadota bacterium]